MDYKFSFEPLAGKEARVLVLGSIPGDRSLELNEYYGHPQNRFWRMLACLCNETMPGTYPEKKELLLRNGIALWDVAHKAVRPGSMDSDIRNEAPNDIPALMASLPNLHTVAFNGKTAEKLYDKYFSRLPGIRYLPMPSTSPANARFTLDKLCACWGQMLQR
ncbi:MAG: DNA-deoxyinosine glycosylase [Bacteroides sp.]|nr:DNA-deoxyinosine glycosylase [Ruminococcus flavefaciens]MCM1555529.1 DNA-deoxyinosine glycosylase [Bacteroides sp.]